MAAAGISHAPGTRTTSIADRLAPLRSKASNAPSSSRSVITAFQRDTTMAKRIPSAERSPSTATGLPLSGSVHAQKLKGNPALGAQPVSSVLMHGIEGRHLNQHIGGRGKLAIDKLQVAQRRQKRRTAARLLLPSGAGSEPQR